MSWLDFFKNAGNKVGNIQSKVGSVLGEALIGKQEPMIDYVDIKGVNANSPEFAENAPIAEIGVTEAPRVGGLLNDIRSGTKENFATGFAAPNWEQTITPDGRKKGLGYRLGEGLGSFARFAESPLGRGLIMAGIVGASGGSGLEALGYGAGAGLGNQQARMKDKMYRNELEKMGFDTNGITGYVGDDTFNKIYQSKQLQDNAEYRNALLKGQRLEQDALIAQKQAELNHKKMSEAADRALKSRELDIKEYQALNEGKGTQNNEQKLNEMQAQLDDFVSTFDLVDNPYRYRIAGGVSNVLNTLTPEEANFNAKRTLLFNAIARKLADEKGVLSDQDIKRIDDALPKLADTKKQKMAKMGATYSLLDIRRGYKTPQAQTGNTTKSGVKYEVID